MSSNMQRLGNVLINRMRKTSTAAVPIAVELGSIHDNLSLTTDTLPVPIPKGDYMVSKTMTGALQSGDRVLVAWCGNEPVVVAVVVSS